VLVGLKIRCLKIRLDAGNQDTVGRTWKEILREKVFRDY
jgi:hypothetical protein